MDSAILGVLYLLTFFLGASLGSFINVYTYRAPRILLEDNYKDSLSKPDSYCPSCNTKIPWKFLIPVLGYFLSKRQCHSCNDPISIHYPIVELAYGLTPIIIYVLNGWSPLTIVFIVLLMAAYPIILIDFKHQLILDTSSLTLLWVALLLASLNYSLIDPTATIQGAIAGYLFLSIPAYLYKQLRGVDGMGLGDAKLLAAMGAFFGWQELPFIVLFASVLGIFIYIYERIKTGNTNPYFAFGPAIIIGAVVNLLMTL